MSIVPRSAVLGCVALLAATLSGCASLGVLSPLRPVERAIVFQGAKYPAGNWRPENLAVEDAWFEADDGTKLHGWFIDRTAPRGVVLFCHGNGDNITILTDKLRNLSEQHGLAVLTFDYRGYGRSEGAPSESGILQDARAARRWLAKRTRIDERAVILMGHSLGGAVAVDLAAKDGARALILESTFTSLPEVAATHLPWLAPRWNMTMQLNSASKLPSYAGPLLVSHGDADEVIPFEHGERLLQVAGGAPKRFFRERGGRHNDPRSADYDLALDDFLTLVASSSATAVSRE